MNALALFIFRRGSTRRRFRARAPATRDDAAAAPPAPHLSLAQGSAQRTPRLRLERGRRRSQSRRLATKRLAAAPHERRRQRNLKRNHPVDPAESRKSELASSARSRSPALTLWKGSAPWPRSFAAPSPVPLIVAPPATRAAPPRRATPILLEVAEHLLTEKLPLVAAATELVHCAKTGRFPLRTVLLVAALAI